MKDIFELKVRAEMKVLTDEKKPGYSLYSALIPSFSSRHIYFQIFLKKKEEISQAEEIFPSL